MGVKCLWDILESCKTTLPLHHLQNKRVCIDLSCWMVQLQNVNKSHCAMKEKLYLRGLFHRIRALIALNCSLIFVTDGAIPAVKISTYKKRLNIVDECAKGDMNGQKVTSLKRNMGSEFSCMVREAKTLGMALGIPCLDGIEEAEAQCALLNFESICDGCFSSDSDIFLFGARTVYRDICLGDGGYVVCYEMKDIEKKLGLGRHSLIAFALLLGSDYSHGVHGYGPESACQVIRSVGEDLFLQRIASEGVSFLKSLKSLKKHGQFPKAKGKENHPPQQEKATGNQEEDNEFSRVIDAYMKPKCHPVDSDHVYRVLSVYPFRRAELQHICDQSFGWPSEKTDEYILPRIAERELRKFANLRLSSSQFGVVLPLHEMPIKCPISEVLKRRRVQCKDCLEVSWEEFDGLKTSVVPADLVESACPEKIAEFEERIAQKKKPNCRKPRSKKSEDKSSSMAILDQKLQELLLEIESEDNIRRGHSLCSTTSTLGITSKNDSMTSGTFVNRQYQSKFTIEPSVDCPSHPPTTMETDVVDLLSPWPRKSDNKTSVVNIDLRFQEMLSEIESEENARRGQYPCSSSSATIYESKITNEPTSGYPSDPMDVIDLLSPEPKKSEDKSDSLCSSSTLGMSSKSDSLMSGTLYNEQCDSKITTEAPTTTVEMDMIDLLSPSPEPRARYVSNCKGYSEEVSVIDLSDSDVEMSPEHSQKAKELRVFLASIRKEIH